MFDTKHYWADPKTKSEPLLDVMGKRDTQESFSCSTHDTFGARSSLSLFELEFDTKWCNQGFRF